MTTSHIESCSVDELIQRHSVFSLMMTLDHGIGAPVTPPFHTDQTWQRHNAAVQDQAQSIHRHHVQPLLDEIEALRLRLTVASKERVRRYPQCRARAKRSG